MLWRCWLGGRKGIQPVKNWVVWCPRYLFEATCRLAYGPADATAIHCLWITKSTLCLSATNIHYLAMFTLTLMKSVKESKLKNQYLAVYWPSNRNISFTFEPVLADVSKNSSLFSSAYDRASCRLDETHTANTDSLHLIQSDIQHMLNNTHTHTHTTV